MNEQLHHHKPIVVLVFLLMIGSAITFLWYLKDTKGPVGPMVIVPQVTTESSTTQALQADANAGSTTDSTSVVSNPIQDAYQNPFE